MRRLRAARWPSSDFPCRKGRLTHRAVGALQRAAFPQQPRAALRPRSHAVRSRAGSVLTCAPTAGTQARRMPRKLQCPRSAGASHLHAHCLLKFVSMCVGIQPCSIRACLHAQQRRRVARRCRWEQLRALARGAQRSAQPPELLRVAARPLLTTKGTPRVAIKSLTDLRSTCAHGGHDRQAALLALVRCRSAAGPTCVSSTMISRWRVSVCARESPAPLTAPPISSFTSDRRPSSSSISPRFAAASCAATRCTREHVRQVK